jgi:hypothetical protein
MRIRLPDLFQTFLASDSFVLGPDEFQSRDVLTKNYFRELLDGGSILSRKAPDS